MQVWLISTFMTKIRLNTKTENLPQACMHSTGNEDIHFLLEHLETAASVLSHLLHLPNIWNANESFTWEPPNAS